MTGIPGSGKTTLAHKLGEQCDAIVHSYDDMLMANTKHSMSGNVKRAWIQNMRDDLLQGHNVVCDGMPLTIKDRLELVAAFADIPCEKILCIKTVPLDICLQRNRERQRRLPDFVIEQAAQKLEMPINNEGFDEIYVYKN